MSHAEEYQRRAAGCILIAEETTDLASRLQLMEMAKAWLRLAEQAEKNSHADFVSEPPMPRRRITQEEDRHDVGPVRPVPLA